LGAGVVYEWCGHPWANSAICSFSPRDARKLLEEARRRYDAGECRRRNSTGLPDAFHPRERFEAFFDSPVGELPGFRLEALQRRGELELADWWPGAYAYHWHNGWSLPILPSSPADVLWKALERVGGGRVAGG